MAHKLLLKGKLSLKSLNKYLDLKKETISEALFILIQQNIVSFTDVKDNGVSITLYFVLIKNVFNLLFIPLVFNLIEERFGFEVFSLLNLRP